MRKHIKHKKLMDVPGDPDNARILVNELDDGDRREISAFANKNIINQRTNRVEEEVNPVLHANALAEKRIAGWENFFEEVEDGLKGPPIACNPENVRAFSRQAGFMTMLRVMGDEVDLEAAEKRRAALKN